MQALITVLYVQLVVVLGLKQNNVQYLINNMKTNIIYNEDCIGEKGMKILPNKSIDMILCDLPYGRTACKWDKIIAFEPLWKQYKRVIKDRGAIVLTASQPFTSMLVMSNLKMFKYCWVWEKSKPTNFLNAKKQPLRKYEDICVFYKRQPAYNPQMSEGKPYNKGVRKDQLTGSYSKFNAVEVKSKGERYPIDVIYFKTAESEGKVVHPTQKPVALFQYLIKTYINEGDIVLDNCIGSGTTAIACKRLNRKYIGYEINSDYIKLIHKRLSKEDTLFNVQS